jgi:small-conductance mechanosensitive channel
MKHPFDVGDRVSINNMAYTVKEIFLLSSVFVDSHGTLVQAPNTLLNTMVLRHCKMAHYV